MGLSDRDYTRDDEEYGYEFRGPARLSARSMTVTLIIINVAVYLADALFSVNHGLMLSLAVGPDTLTKPWLWWQFLTAGFAHSPTQIFHLLGNMIGLFFFGRWVEERIGRMEFLRFYLLAIIAGNVLAAVRTYFFDPSWGGVLGASGGVTAVIILFICFYPRERVFLFAFPMPAWLLGAIIIASDVLGSLSTPPPNVPAVAHDVHLAGAVIGFAYWRLGWNFRYLMPTLWRSSLRRWWNRPRLRVVEEEPSYAELDAQAEALLDKVLKQGQESLTPRERKILEDYSRRMRQKLR